MKYVVFVASVLLTVQTAFADVTLTDKASTLRRDANAAKRLARQSRRLPGARTLETTQSQDGLTLTDSAGLQYFINTDLTNTTGTSEMSGAADEASYAGPVMASTMAGGVAMSTLSDMFDGYNALCVSLTNATGPCSTGDVNYTLYIPKAMGAFDATVPAVPECTNRQFVLPAQTMGPLTVQRKVYVPTNDTFIRWLNSFTNTSGAPVTFTMVTSNNLGSDSNTIIVNSSNGDAVAQTTDTWVTTFQNFSPTTSSDPRIGHVLQGAGAPTPVSNIHFANGDDNPYWAYSITLAPGQTKLIMNFATGSGMKTQAASQAAALAGLSTTSTQCMSATQLGQVTNFAVNADLSIVKTASVVTNVNAGQAYSYNLAVTNNGPGAASSVSVSDPLPPGVAFVSASGTGWSCGQAAGVVTCTLPSLAVGSANPITINVTAPTSAATLTNTATVSSATSDPTPGNNSSTNVLTVSNADLSISKTTGVASVFGGQPVTYTIAVTNNGPGTAGGVSVSDTLPAGSSFVSASGTGWTCNAVAGVVTCTRPTLAVGAAPAISLTFNAPSTSSVTTLSNTATVSSTTVDPTPGNNSSTSVITLQPIGALPAMDGKALALLAGALCAIAAMALRRG